MKKILLATLAGGYPHHVCICIRCRCNDAYFSQLPMKSHLGRTSPFFKDEVESKSGGDIVVEIYDSAQLYKDKEVPAAVGSGAIEAGVASLTRYVGDIRRSTFSSAIPFRYRG